jgi:hypothetical protein
MGHRLVQTRRGEILPAGCNTDLSLRCPRINPDTRGGLQALFLFPCTPERKKGVPVLLHPGGPTPPPPPTYTLIKKAVGGRMVPAQELPEPKGLRSSSPRWGPVGERSKR